MQVKHVLRGFSVLTFVLVILAVMISPYSAVFAETGMDLSKELEILRRREASEASSVFSEALYADSFTDEDNVRKPDYYAGHYIDDNDVLHLCFANPTNECINAYQSLLVEYKNTVIFEDRDLSFNDLNTYGSQIVSGLQGLGCVVYSWGPIAADNSIEILVSESSYDLALQNISNINSIPNLTVTIGVAEAPQRMSGTDLVGGDEIVSKISTIDYHMTLSATGTYNSSNAFLTCGHDIRPSSSLYTSSGTVFGTADYVRFSNNASGDFTVGTLKSGFNPTHRARNGNSSSILWKGYKSSPAESDYVKKYGITGKLAYATVDRTSYTIVYPDIGYSITNTIRARLTSGTVQSGDSGGPCWTDNLKFCGVLCASLTNSSGSYFLFTPYSTIKAVGFTVYANHTGTYVYHNTTYHKNNCSLCGGYVYESHTGTWSDYNSTYHKSYCSICNQTIYEPHSAYYVQSENKCSRCGRVGNFTSDSIVDSPNYQRTFSHTMQDNHSK